jgi:hypothetical protein
MALLRWQYVAVLAFFLAAGVVTETHPHWTVLAYPPAAVALAALWVHRPRHVLVRLLKPLAAASAATLALAALACVVAPPLIRRAEPAWLGEYFGSRTATAYVRLFGWGEVASRLAEVSRREYGRADGAVYTNRYQWAAMLSFHRPAERAAIALEHLDRQRLETGDAPRFYLPWEELAGGSGLYVVDDRADRYITGKLERAFEEAEELAPLEVHYSGTLARRLRVFRVSGFRPRAEGRP